MTNQWPHSEIKAKLGFERELSKNQPAFLPIYHCAPSAGWRLSYPLLLDSAQALPSYSSL